MAQLVLSAASSVVGAVGRAGIGAALARTVASTAAGFVAGQVDRLIFGPRKRKVEGPRLAGFTVQASTEGASILRVYGRGRIAGQLIWAANFKETVSETTENAGGKSNRPAVQTEITEYIYSISFAVGLCEGVIDRIGRVWADGKLLDLSRHNFRVYRGTQGQNPDPLIEATEAAGKAPGFRGLAYVVFEDLLLKDFGNRIPQLSFEIEKSLGDADPDALENIAQAVTLIPGSGEFVYGTTPVLRQTSEGAIVPENTHNSAGVTDFTASLDGLEASLPNLTAVSLVVSWFGDSLNAGACTLRPGVDAAAKTTTPYGWRAGDVDRAGAHLVSTLNGAAAYGGTPADRAVIEAIAAINARGLEVMFHPFILMDDPGYSWRGRINVGANDKTAAAASDIAAFFGTAAPSDFSLAGSGASGAVIYNGPAEWSFRRMILHYAHLCVLAGGVESFLIGSELRGITTARDGGGAYRAVAALRALAADVRGVLGPSVKISYGADWSEYFGHQPGDGSGDAFFHLDDFWADANVDFIGIDNYWPLADWRDGFSHTDYLGGAASQYDLDYLKSNIEGGEGYDWYYASAADRDAQVRSPISDGAYGEAWIYRYKDIRSWWSNAHHNRPGGVREISPGPWVPQSKPFRFTEIGAPAVDKGANQPNVFIDPKSVESATPYYSSGGRDDLAQRRLLEAHGLYWAGAGANPVSPVYGGAMVEAGRQYIYAWDGRPFPFFPARGDVWGDGANWARGHWLNGRLGRAPLDLLVTALANEANFTNIDTSALKGVITGYIIDRPMSPRAMIDPLADVYQFDMVEAGGTLRFQSRDAGPIQLNGALTLTQADFTEQTDANFSVSLGQQSDLPSAFRLGFLDEGADYGPAVAEARNPVRDDIRDTGIEIAGVLGDGEAQARARSILADAQLMRETAAFSLPPSFAALQPGDAIMVTLDGEGGADPVARSYRVTEITDGAARAIACVRVSPSVYQTPQGAMSFNAPAPPPVFGAPVWALMDLPLLRDGDDPAAPHLAAFADPWPGAVALYREPASSAPTLAGVAPARAVMGRLETSLAPGASGRWLDQTISIRLLFGTLASRAEEDVLGGANALAVQSANGEWEILQFRDAALAPDGAWTLSGLLRGQAGSEAEAAAGADIGARAVLLSPAVAQISASLDLRDLAFDWSAGPVSALVGSQSFSGQTLSYSARRLKPLSPVHLKAQNIDGDIGLAWIRRTRIGGDSWAGADAPLGEAFERYQVRVFDGGAEVRIAETPAADYIYTAAMQTEDFPGGAPETLTFKVAQISDLVGPGGEAEIDVEL